MGLYSTLLGVNWFNLNYINSTDINALVRQKCFFFDNLRFPSEPTLKINLEYHKYQQFDRERADRKG